MIEYENAPSYRESKIKKNILKFGTQNPEIASQRHKYKLYGIS